MPPSTLQSLLWLRERLKNDDCGTAVWVSAPTSASFALSLRLAPVQIFWALRFHPITGSYIDGYITYGPEPEHERLIGKQSWLVCPVPLGVAVPCQNPAEVDALRKQFPHKVLLGTLAREEKINSLPFLEAIVRVLHENPDAGYVWTGKNRHAGIDNFFNTHGVGERCHFRGWVNTPMYAAALDVFLETFPLGCGVTGYQALAAGTPLVSYLEENTVYGMHFGHGMAAAEAIEAEGQQILCARTPDEYVALASRLIADPGLREAAGERGRAFFGAEMEKSSVYAARFFDTVAGVARRVMTTRTDSA